MKMLKFLVLVLLPIAILCKPVVDQKDVNTNRVDDDDDLPYDDEEEQNVDNEPKTEAKSSTTTEAHPIVEHFEFSTEFSTIITITSSSSESESSEEIYASNETIIISNVLV